MSTDIRNDVIHLLENYAEIQRKIALLRYELEHPVGISNADVIESMNFAKGTGEGQPVGHISNKTMYIAMNYQEQAAKLNIQWNDGIATKLHSLERDVAKLQYLLSLMEPIDSEIITEFYIQRKSIDDLATTMDVSRRTLTSQKAKAINRLIDMYAYTADV